MDLPEYRIKSEVFENSKVAYGRPSTKQISEESNDILIAVDKMCSLLKKTKAMVIGQPMKIKGDVFVCYLRFRHMFQIIKVIIESVNNML